MEASIVQQNNKNATQQGEVGSIPGETGPNGLTNHMGEEPIVAINDYVGSDGKLQPETETLESFCDWLEKTGMDSAVHAAFAPNSVDEEPNLDSSTEELLRRKLLQASVGGSEKKARIRNTKTGQIDFDEVLNLWNFLEDNGFDMSRFRKYIKDGSLLDKFKELQRNEGSVKARKKIDTAHLAQLRQESLAQRLGQGARTRYIDKDLFGVYRRREGGIVQVAKVDNDELKKSEHIRYIDEDLSGVYMRRDKSVVRVRELSQRDLLTKSANLRRIDENLSGVYKRKDQTVVRVKEMKDGDALKKSEHIRYIDEDLSGVYKARHGSVVRVKEMHGADDLKKSEHLRYIDEDLSGVYKRKNNSVVRVDEVEDGDDLLKSEHIRYIDEDLSSVYKDGSKGLFKGKDGRVVKIEEVDSGGHDMAKLRCIEEDLSGMYKGRDGRVVHVEELDDAEEFGEDSEIRYIDEDLSGVYKGRDGRVVQVEAVKKDDGKAQASELRYIEEDLSGIYKGRDGRVVSVEEAESDDDIDTSGELRYIEEDLSGVYRQKDGNVIRIEEVPEEDDIGKSAPTRYIDEDLSSIDETEAENESEKPSFEAMVNYWGVSKRHSKRKHSQTDMPRPDGETVDEKNVNNWENEPSKNTMMNALKWLDGKGIDVNALAKDAEAAQSSQPLTAEDVDATAAWIQNQGLGAPTQETLSTAVPESSAAPQKSDLGKALAWLQRQGKAPNRPEPNKAPDSNDSLYDSDILHTLSWLKKSGFDLDKSIAGPQKDSSTSASEQMVNQDSPTMEVLIDTLAEISDDSDSDSDSSDSDTEDQSKPRTPDNDRALKWLNSRGFGKKKPTKKSKKKRQSGNNTRQGSKQKPDGAHGSTTKPRDEESLEPEDDEDNGPQGVSTAMQWLQKKGLTGSTVRKSKTPKAKSKKKPRESNVSAADAESALAAMKAHPEARQDAPSTAEMEDAVKFLKIRESKKTQRPPRMPSTKGMEKALGLLNRRNAAAVVEKPIDASSSSSTHSTSASTETGPKKRPSKTSATKRTSSASSAKLSAAEQSALRHLAGAARKRVAANRSSPGQGASTKTEIDKTESKKSQEKPSAIELVSPRKKRPSLKKKETSAKTQKRTAPKKSKSGKEASADDTTKKTKKTKKKKTPSIPKARARPPLTRPSLATRQQSMRALDKSLEESKKKASPPPKKEKDEDSGPVGPDYENALQWLTNPNSKVEDAAYFKRLDNILPRRATQTKHARAREMAKALNWVKKKEVMGGKGKNVPEKKQEPASPKKPKSENDFKNALKWLKAKDKDKKTVEDAAFFKKLDAMLPKKAGQTLEDRAQDLVKSLKWVRKSSGGGEDGAAATASSRASAKGGRKAEPVGNSWKTARGMLPSVKDMAKQAKARKKGGPAEALAPASAKASAAPGTQPKSSPDQDFSNAVAFIHAKRAGTDTTSLVDANHFKSLDNMLPKKKDQSPEDRAKEMVKMLGWLRKKGKA